jgi:serine phosphatase RsbU (regulator of sigma subunit)
LFSDGVTEARNSTDRGLYGDERLRRLVAGLGDLPAVAMAEAIHLAALAFTGGRLSDDVVVFVMKVPARESHSLGLTAVSHDARRTPSGPC